VTKKESKEIITMKQEKSRSNVRFEANEKVLEIPHYNDYTMEEKKLTWLQDSDYIDIVVDNKIVATQMMQGKKPKDESARGLERFVTKTAMRQDRAVEDARDAVMAEQEKQQQDNAVNPEKLAKVYSEKTRHSQDFAHTVGLEDLEASRIEDETSKEPTAKRRKRKSVTARLTGAMRAIRILPMR
jgi:hypothetical protein